MHEHSDPIIFAIFNTADNCRVYHSASNHSVRLHKNYFIESNAILFEAICCDWLSCVVLVCKEVFMLFSGNFNSITITRIIMFYENMNILGWSGPKHLLIDYIDNFFFVKKCLFWYSSKNAQYLGLCLLEIFFKKT